MIQLCRVCILAFKRVGAFEILGTFMGTSMCERDLEVLKGAAVVREHEGGLLLVTVRLT